MALSKPSSSSPPTLVLPDVLAHWPWPRRINPFYEEVSAASAAWLRSFHAFSPAAQRAFDKCQFGLLASLAFPEVSKDHLRTGCDLMNLFFVIDEHTDVVDDPAQARAMVAVVLDALRRPGAPRPPGEWVGGEVARQFWARARGGLCALAQAHFVDAFARYLDAVAVEAADRAEAAAAAAADRTGGTVAAVTHSVESYLALRSETIGLVPSLAVNLAALDALTAADLADPAVAALVALGTTLIGLGNDLVSYPKERAEAAAEHNVVTVVLRSRRHVQDQKDTTPTTATTPGTLEDEQAAVDWVARYHGELERAFLARHAALGQARRAAAPDAPATHQILAFADCIGQWVRSNDQWSFESARYFGSQGAAVQRSRRVVLRPIHKKATPLSEALGGEGEGEGEGGAEEGGRKEEGAWRQGGGAHTGQPLDGSLGADPLLYGHGRVVSTVVFLLLVAVLGLLVRKVILSAGLMRSYYEL